MLGIYLQASCIISIFFSIIISVIWIYTEPILIFLHQDPLISKKAASFLKLLIPGLFAYGFLHNILRFLQTQSIVMPLVVCSVLPLVTHIGIAYVLVHFTAMGFEGAALAASISLWASVMMLGSYVLFAKKFRQTWKGFSLESFHHVLGNLKLALPSAAMVWLVLPFYFWSQFHFYNFHFCVTFPCLPLFLFGTHTPTNICLQRYLVYKSWSDKIVFEDSCQNLLQ